ncbi:MAG: YHS domain protein [Flavobacteriaceae bacterium]|nr:YHS domain protein [Flavobacteriaceae bacterium]MCY4253684.1 YHS domain protein [Flavobacteriaceae bacterium]
MNSLYVISVMLLLCLVNSTYSQKKKDNMYNTDKENVAASGYDVVAYFTEDQALEGDQNITSTFQGVTYLFTSQKNKDIFEQSPLKYTPQYGGWCAYAMGRKGEKVSVNPKAYSIENGKLYLFYKKGGTDTLKRWQKNTAELKSQADKEWAKLTENSSN